MPDPPPVLGWVTSAQRPGAGPPPPEADLAALTRAIERLTEALGGRPLAAYERELPQRAAAEAARRVGAEVVALLLDDGQGRLEVAGGIGLTVAERALRVGYDHQVLAQLFWAGVGVIEDTATVRISLAGLPGGQAATLVLVPLVHRHVGFGVLAAGGPGPAFGQTEVDALLGFADGASAELHATALARHLLGRLRALERSR